MYNRLFEWLEFNSQVMRHIEQYTMAQYGNKEGNEQVDSFSVEDCFKSMERYFNRRNANVRGNKEKLRDLIKIAHYAQLAYDKLRRELDERDVYSINVSCSSLIISDDINEEPVTKEQKAKLSEWYTTNVCQNMEKKDANDK